MATMKTPRRMGSNGTLFIRGIPDALKNKFKALCASQGITMHKKIVELMKRTIKQGEHK